MIDPRALLMSIVTIILIPAGVFIGYYSAHDTHFNKPYIILFEKVTPQDKLLCEKDENCMDIMDLSILPTRNEK